MIAQFHSYFKPDNVVEMNLYFRWLRFTNYLRHREALFIAGEIRVNYDKSLGRSIERKGSIVTAIGTGL